MLGSPPAGLALLSRIVFGGTSSLTGEALPFWPASPPTRFATSYFLFNAFAPFQPVATCSPCRSRKLFAVAAEVRASAREMDEGSLRNWVAVWRAACFWAKVVPWDGDGDGAAAATAAAAVGGALGEEDVGEVVIFEKRLWRLLMDGDWVVVGLDVGGAFVELDSLRHVFEAGELACPPPIPKPGTETPAFPSRPKAP